MPDIILNTSADYSVEQRRGYNRAMTVGRLKALLETLPNDLVLVAKTNTGEGGAEYINDINVGTVYYFHEYAEDYDHLIINADDEIFDEVQYLIFS